MWCNRNIVIIMVNIYVWKRMAESVVGRCPYNYSPPDNYYKVIIGDRKLYTIISETGRGSEAATTS